MQQHLKVDSIYYLVIMYVFKTFDYFIYLLSYSHGKNYLLQHIIALTVKRLVRTMRLLIKSIDSEFRIVCCTCRVECYL